MLEIKNAERCPAEKEAVIGRCKTALSFGGRAPGKKKVGEHEVEDLSWEASVEHPTISDFKPPGEGETGPKTKIEAADKLWKDMRFALFDH